jgi:hypothetical protein
LKQVTSTGVKLFNWNIISETLNKIGIQVDADIKVLIVKGDCDMINELLKDIMLKFDVGEKKKDLSKI